MEVVIRAAAAIVFGKTSCACCFLARTSGPCACWLQAARMNAAGIARPQSKVVSALRRFLDPGVTIGAC